MIGTAIKYGIKKGLSLSRTVSIAYLIQLIFAVIVALQFSTFFTETIGDRLAVRNLLSRYDHTVISDFRRIYAEGLAQINQTLLIILIIYLIFSVFLQGGILNNLSKPTNSIREFIQGGIRNYLSFFAVLLFSLFLLIIWAAITIYPLTGLYERMFNAQVTESQVFLFFLISGLLFFLGFALVFNWSVLSRLQYLRQSGSIFRCMGIAFREIFHHFPKGIGLFAIFFLIQILLVLLYWILDGLIGPRSGFTIVLFFFIQQLFIIARIFWRVMLYAGIEQMYLRTT